MTEHHVSQAVIPAIALALTLLPMPAQATQEKIAEMEGERIVRNSMTIEAEYIQPVELQNGKVARKDADIYLQAHIKAASANPLGFSKFAWIPFLDVRYTLKKTGSNWQSEGRLDPAIAQYGPHYGANVKLDGFGKYHLTLHVAPPTEGIYRHIGVDTGLVFWKPFNVDWNFNYLGVGKRTAVGGSGGY